MLKKGFIISWPFLLDFSHMSSSQFPLTVLFPPFASLLLPLTASACFCLPPSVSPPPSHRRLTRVICSEASAWHRKGRHGNHQPSSSATPDLPCLSPSPFSLSFSLRFDVNLTADVRELSLNCCQIRWLSPSSSGSTGFNEPRGRHGGFWTGAGWWGAKGDIHGRRGGGGAKGKKAIISTLWTCVELCELLQMSYAEEWITSLLTPSARVQMLQNIRGGKMEETAGIHTMTPAHLSFQEDMFL